MGGPNAHRVLGLCLVLLLAVATESRPASPRLSSQNLPSDADHHGWFPSFSTPHKDIKPGLRERLRMSVQDDSLPNELVLGQTRPQKAAKSVASNSGMEATLSRAGLNYAKDVLVGKVLDEITPLGIPDIRVETVTSFGTVLVELSRINLTDARVFDAAIALGDDDGITIFAQGVEANASFSWKYTYAGLVGDSGTADVKVEGLQAGMSFNLTAVNGTLKMAVLESGAVVERLSIVLHNSYSWIYNWLVSSFTNHLRAAIESAINAGMVRASLKLDTYLQGLPRQIPVDSTAAIDATIVDNPVVETDRLSFGPRGEFVNASEPLQSRQPPPPIPDGVLCGDSQKMVTIALTDFVVNSAARVYYEAGKLTYLVDQLPDASPLRLNTASWRFLLPALYSKYPNQDMVLEFITAAAPEVTFTSSGLRTTWAADMVIAVVQEDGSHLGVACLSLTLLMEGWAGINGNNVTGTFQLGDLSLALKWSHIGTFPVRTLQAVIKTVVKNVVLPIINRQLALGFPLPVVPGVEIQDAAVVYGDQYLLVCTDIEYTGGLFSHENVLQAADTGESLRRALQGAGEETEDKSTWEEAGLDSRLLGVAM